MSVYPEQNLFEKWLKSKETNTANSKNASSYTRKIPENPSNKELEKYIERNHRKKLIPWITAAIIAILSAETSFASENQINPPKIEKQNKKIDLDWLQDWIQNTNEIKKLNNLINFNWWNLSFEERLKVFDKLVSQYKIIEDSVKKSLLDKNYFSKAFVEHLETSKVDAAVVQAVLWFFGKYNWEIDWKNIEAIKHITKKDIEKIRKFVNYILDDYYGKFDINKKSEEDQLSLEPLFADIFEDNSLIINIISALCPSSNDICGNFLYNNDFLSVYESIVPEEDDKIYHDPWKLSEEWKHELFKYLVKIAKILDKFLKG